MGVIDLQPDLDGPQGAIAFLKHWCPNAPLIFASHTDPVKGTKGAFEARQFRAPVDWDQVRSWIASRQKDGQWCNMYFSVNTALGDVNKKLGRADIADMVALHVDVDIAPGEDQAEGIARIVSVFQKYKHAPTDIITSGGGAQAFWRLEPAVPVGGDETIAEDLKLYNKTVEAELEGDHCHSLDHIMRLPGTVNIPNEVKLKKGRKPRLAVWHSTTANTYPITAFAKAEPEQKLAAKAAGFKTPETFVSVAATDERLVKLGTTWLALGTNGDTKGEYGGDRSRAVLAFTTACLRAKIDRDLIASILMDVNWKIGECIRDKGGETRRQLRRLIERAGKFVDEDVEKPAVLGRDTWMKTAEQFILRKMPDIRFFNGDWYVYMRGVYVVTEDGLIRAAIRRFLNESKMTSVTGEGDDKKTVLVPFNPNTNDVNETMSALRDTVFIDRDALVPPCWIEDASDRPAASEFINVTNGLLHLPTQKLMEHTPDFFSLVQSEVAYDPAAQCPTWHRVLHDYWPKDGESEPLEHALLQEMMGYTVSPWRDLQKIFSLVGPGRSGKGTIGKVLTMLVGKKNVTAPLGLGALAAGTFSITSFLHKTVCLIGEAGFGFRDDRTAITNILKTISGQDEITIERKFKDSWIGRLLVQIWLNCNQIPDFQDAGKALLARLIPLAMTVSFADNPDEQLEDKLRAEAPGILNWVIAGLLRLIKSGGKFTMPESSLAMREVFGRMSSPVASFLEECTEPHVLCHVTEDDLYETFKLWAEKNGQHNVPTKGKVVESVCSYEPAKYKRNRPRLDNDGNEYSDKKRPLAVQGLKLKRAVPAAKAAGPKAANDGEIPF